MPLMTLSTQVERFHAEYGLVKLTLRLPSRSHVSEPLPPEFLQFHFQVSVFSDVARCLRHHVKLLWTIGDYRCSHTDWVRVGITQSLGRLVRVLINGSLYILKLDSPEWLGGRWGRVTLAGFPEFWVGSSRLVWFSDLRVESISQVRTSQFEFWHCQWPLGW